MNTDDLWYSDVTGSAHVLWTKHSMNFRCPCGNYIGIEDAPKACGICGRVYQLSTALECSDPLNDLSLVEDSDLLLDWMTRAYLALYTPRYIIDHCRLFGNEKRADELYALFMAAVERRLLAGVRVVHEDHVAVIDALARGVGARRVVGRVDGEGVVVLVQLAGDRLSGLVAGATRVLGHGVPLLVASPRRITIGARTLGAVGAGRDDRALQY